MDWSNFTKKPNYVNNLKNKLKCKHFNQTLSQHEKRLKHLWKILKTLVPNEKFKSTSVKSK